MVGDLALQGGLQQPLRQLLEQSALAGQLQSLGLSSGDQLVDQPVIHHPRRLRLYRLAYLGLGHVLTGHRCILHDRELHRTIYSPAGAGSTDRAAKAEGAAGV
ncbi:hypothetical protein OHA19_39725 (plasmid) [Streptomyces sp. NBC_00012]|uniref:hypothetical protein n=1 Tax=Streptomyces sp. NBC_00012 TaxID=2975621 RepID=UPI00324F77D8